MNDQIDINPDTSISAHLDTFILDRPFIMTTNKELVIGSPYLYSEGNRTAAVRLVKTWVEDHIIYLDVEELKSPKTFSLSWNMNYSGSYYLWTLADLHTIMNLTNRNL